MTVVLASVAFWAPITLRLIGDDGQPELIQGRARYQRLKTSERRALDRRIRANHLTPSVRESIQARLDDPASNYTPRERREIAADLAAEPITDAQFVADLVVDWDLRDRSGAVILYSPAMRDALCEDWDGLEAALVRGYLEAQKSVLEPKETEKNSEAPSATGS